MCFWKPFLLGLEMWLKATSKNNAGLTLIYRNFVETWSRSIKWWDCKKCLQVLYACVMSMDDFWRFVYSSTCCVARIGWSYSLLRRECGPYLEYLSFIQRSSLLYISVNNKQACYHYSHIEIHTRYSHNSHIEMLLAMDVPYWLPQWPHPQVLAREICLFFSLTWWTLPLFWKGMTVQRF